MPRDKLFAGGEHRRQTALHIIDSNLIAHGRRKQNKRNVAPFLLQQIHRVHPRPRRTHVVVRQNDVVIRHLQFLDEFSLPAYLPSAANS